MAPAADGRPCQAEWVAHPTQTAAADSYLWWRAEAQVDVPAAAALHLSADSRYRVWVNGRPLPDGPVPSQPGAAYVDTHDVGPLLLPGLNCLAVAVHYVGPGLDRGPLLLCELEVDGQVLAATGLTPWRTRVADAWVTPAFAMPFNVFDPFQEVYDARREPQGWRDVGFDDSQWLAGSAVGWPGSGDQPLVEPRPVPPMAEQPRRFTAVAAVEECLWLRDRSRPDLSISLSQAGRPLSYADAQGLPNLVSGDGPAVLSCSDEHLRDPTFDGVYDPCVLLDLGRVEAAYVELDVEGPAGAALDVGVAERLIDDRFNNAIEGQFASRYVLREGRQTFRTFAWRGFRYARLRLTEASGPVRLHSVHAVVTGYPFDDVGHFASSDPKLDRLVEICRHTVRLCCHESIMDTPWREQAQWLGDVAAVTIPTMRACFGDSPLVGKYFREAARTQQPSTGTLASISNGPTGDRDIDVVDYSLWWVVALLDQYLYSGDESLLHDLFPVVRGVLDGVLEQRSSRGLVRAFQWVFIDWADVDVDGEPAALNAILYGALRAGARLAEQLQAAAERQRWESAAAQLRAAYLPTYWDADRQVLVDSSTARWSSSTVSEHTNFAAIRFGLVDDEMGHRLADRLLVERTPDVTEAQPFFSSVVLDALYRIDRMDLALSVVRERWGARFVDRGYSSTPEEWGINGSWRSGSFDGFMRTLSHAWSAYPAAFLIQRLAGIEPVDPGCRTVRVAPALVDIDYDIRFPTPLGPIEVSKQGARTSVKAPAAMTVLREGRC